MGAVETLPMLPVSMIDHLTVQDALDGHFREEILQDSNEVYV